jgi:hypothetical protein
MEWPARAFTSRGSFSPVFSHGLGDLTRGIVGDRTGLGRGLL